MARAFGHMVFFKLKDDSETAKQSLVAGCQKYLSEHPGTLHFSAGILAPEYDRDYKDLDFDVSLHLVFDTRESHDKYQVADRHNTFLEEFQDNWATVRVFDSDIH